MGKSVAYTGTMVLNSNEQTTCCPPSTSSSNQNQSITPKLIPSSDKKGFGGSNSIEKEIKKLLNN